MTKKKTQKKKYESKDTLKQYYTNTDSIKQYMVNMLGIKPEDKILEPAAGEGSLISAILEKEPKVSINAIEIDPKCIKILQENFDTLPNVHIQETDTLLNEKFDEVSLDFIQKSKMEEEGFSFGIYDKIIANPPYGAWQDYDKRAILKKKYAGHYVKESYALFLLRCLSLLKENGILTFIVPNSFLFLNRHRELRKILFCYSKIKEIVDFPSRFFEGVSFGYTNLCIITLQRTKKESALANSFEFIRGFTDVSEILDTKNENLQKNWEIYRFKQEKLMKSKNHSLILENDLSIFENPRAIKLGDIADVVTGFCCGDNQRFIQVFPEHQKPALPIFEEKILEGINAPEAYLPYQKGSSETPYRYSGNQYFIRWDCDTVSLYKVNPRTRFQNKSYYFRKGVGLPATKSKSIKAVLIEEKLFDQSLVGIFPKDKKDDDLIYFLLGFMNSGIFKRLLFALNPTANNTANYIKEIPVILPDEEKMEKIVKLVKGRCKCDDKRLFVSLENQINEMISDIFDV